MKIAVFSDVHANKHALRAVLADIAGRGPDLVVCLGDLVGYGAFPDDVVQVIEENAIPTVMGNYDDAIANGRMVCGCDYKDDAARERGMRSILWTTENTGRSSKLFMQTLPETITRKAGLYNVLFVHGSPRRLNEYLYEDAPAGYVLSMMEEARASVLVCGHTHLFYHRVIGGRHIINAGSVGRPGHGDPRAVYALLDVAEESVNVQFIKVPYDYEAAARAVESAGLPAAFAATIRTGLL